MTKGGQTKRRTRQTQDRQLSDRQIVDTQTTDTSNIGQGQTTDRTKEIQTNSRQGQTQDSNKHWTATDTGQRETLDNDRPRTKQTQDRQTSLIFIPKFIIAP